jgi:hypothetical protein
MYSFNKRVNKKELLDEPGIPFNDIRRNMEELKVINQYLGGHKCTLKGIKNFMAMMIKKFHIVEIGSGGGDNLKVIQDWTDLK